MSVTPRFAATSAVVTGGSSGIGRAICLSLAEAGLDRLLVHYRQNRAGAEVTASAAEEFGCRTMIAQADLAIEEDVQRLADVAFDRLPTVDTWVNNAGADVLTGDAGELSFERKLKLLLDVDLVGTIGLSRGVGPRRAPQRLGRPPSMIFIGWDQAPRGMEGDAGQMFGPVKAAVMAFAASLAQTLAPRVRVNTVAPGWIRTAWGKTASDEWDRRAKGEALMRRWGTPEDVARAVLYAADPGNTFVTGQTLEVNGGWERKFVSPDA